MKEKFNYYVKLYIKILPITLIIALITLIVLTFVGKPGLINYLNALFIETGVLLMIAGIFSTIALFTRISREDKIKISRLDLRIGYSTLFLIIGATLLTIMFIIHFASKLFI
jgi:hypothetical protein